jgi:putative two-component system response regulator
MPKIMLAEDDDFLRSMTKTFLQMDGFEVVDFPNGLFALEAFSSLAPDLVMSDVSMPFLNGYGLLEGVRKLPGGEVVPFLFLSARNDREDVTQARLMGADDYLFKPYQPDELLTAVRSRLERRRMIESFDSHQAHLETIMLLANLVEGRDEYTRGHVERVQAYALELGRALHWPPDEMAVLEFGSLLHDFGKVRIPEAILNKPGGLTPEELVIMRSHTTIGAKIIEQIPHLRAARPYVLYHHEKWDGSGYPEGLSGEDIPRGGRLLALADVFDALTTTRSYHKHMTAEAALALIRRDAGTHFDPLMVEVFAQIQEEKLKNGTPDSQ